MIYLQETQAPTMDPTLELVFVIIFFVGIASVVLSRLYVYVEQVYALKYYRPFFRNVIIFKKDIDEDQITLLEKEVSFYRNLNKRDKAIFRHRLATFLKQKKFIGREGLVPTDEMKVLIAATAIMLTFGFRNYLIELIDIIVIYPKAYYSQINNTYHKGEINPQLKTMVFSWEDFKKGYHIGDDNLNLGIHEFGHAIHLNAFSSSDVSSLIFNQGFRNLTNFLQHHKIVRQDLIASKYFRTYAYTNHYEFFAVLLENFIETPDDFKSQFPRLYRYMKQMLNFKYAGY